MALQQCEEAWYEYTEVLFASASDLPSKKRL
jgi:hypothetical protein